MSVSLKARLKNRVRPSLEYRLRIDDASGPAAEVEAAEKDLRLARYRDGDESETAHVAQERLDIAKAALEACYETFRVTALAPADMEALVAIHPATNEQQTSGAVWNIDTFRPALLAECVDSDMTEQDWAEFTTKGPVSLGEVRDLWWAVLAINDRTPDSRIPKGSS